MPLTQRVTPLDLIAVANELDTEANLLPPSQIEHSTNLKNIAIMLESYQLKVITKIHHSVVSLSLSPSAAPCAPSRDPRSLLCVNGCLTDVRRDCTGATEEQR